MPKDGIDHRPEEFSSLVRKFQEASDWPSKTRATFSEVALVVFTGFSLFKYPHLSVPTDIK
jgi:hypothetical protein